MIQTEIDSFLSIASVEELMHNYSPTKSIHVHSVERIEVDNSASILVALTSGQTKRSIGHFGLAVSYTENGVLKKQNMVMKVKPNGLEITEMLNSLAQACGGELTTIYNENRALTGFRHTHVREQEIHTKIPSTLTPVIFGVQTDEKNDQYIILMEYLQDVTLLNAVMSPTEFSDAHIKAALEQMAAWHAQNYNQELPLAKNFWTDCPSEKYMKNLSPLWKALLQNAADHFPELYTKQRVASLQRAITNIPNYWKTLEQLPKTLIHNDFNPRNVCYKNENGELKLCVYDWELATYHIPQYDVVEFLCFVLDKDRYHLRLNYLEHYRKALNTLIPSFHDRDKFKYEFDLAALDFGLHRIGMYMMAHTVSPYPFLPRVVESYFDTVQQSELHFINGLENKA